MLPTRPYIYTHSVEPWMESQPQNDVVMASNNALLPSFKSMLSDDWFLNDDLLQNDAFLMHHFNSYSSSSSSSSSCSVQHHHFALSPKQSFSAFFTNPFDNAFDFGSHSGLPFPELSLNPEFPVSQQLSGGGLTQEEAVQPRPLDNAPPTLFQKRAERREAEELVLPELVLPVVVVPRRREGELNYECDEVGKKVENGFDGNVNENGNEIGMNGGEVKEKKNRMPAKNLMAERRRRKKLNDRLYMLRSVVPKISKMDRASILGDAIDYLKELLQQINDLHNELESSPPGSSLPPSASFHPETPTLPTIPCRVKEEQCPTPRPKHQSAKVEVKVREGRAVNIHMFCARRPGLLLSTMRALDNLGLDVQQAVISCFNGFALDVFRAEQCQEDQDVHPEQIKAALLNTAGFHGMI